MDLLGKRMGLRASIVERAEGLYGRYRVTVGAIGGKFNDETIQAAILIMTASFDNESVCADVSTTARIISCSTRELTDALEAISGMMGAESGIINKTSVLERLNLSSLLPVFEVLREGAQRQGVTDLVSPPVIVALIHLAIQSIGSRLKLQTVAEAAFCNLKLATSCRKTLESFLKETIQEIKSNKQLVLQAKEGFGKIPKIRRKGEATLTSIEEQSLLSHDVNQQPVVPNNANDFFAIHAKHDLGYAFMRTGTNFSIENNHNDDDNNNSSSSSSSNSNNNNTAMMV